MRGPYRPGSTENLDNGSTRVKITRSGRLGAVALVGALALAGCGSEGGSSTDNNSGSATIGGQACQSGSLKASGSSAQANAMTEWINAYQEACGATITYQPSGSAAGIQDFINKQTQFAGSDSAIKDQDQTNANTRCGSDAINVPAVGGAIVLAYNLDGVDKLILDPATITGIFESTITKWNDPKIVALNPGVTLPDATIAQMHRSDGSGTTDNFTKFLIATGGWSGAGGKEWTASGGQGQKGSDGVASAVKSTPNSIGYMELSFAQNSSLKTAWLKNGGEPIEATSENAAATIAKATVTGSGNNLPLSIDYKVTDSYPMVLVTYEIACQSGNDASTAGLLKSFLSYTGSSDGQAKLTALGYVPITGDLLTKVQAAFASIS